jgi:hypothetical protein
MMKPLLVSLVNHRTVQFRGEPVVPKKSWSVIGLVEPGKHKCVTGIERHPDLLAIGKRRCGERSEKSCGLLIQKGYYGHGLIASCEDLVLELQERPVHRADQSRYLRELLIEELRAPGIRDNGSNKLVCLLIRPVAEAR